MYYQCICAAIVVVIQYLFSDSPIKYKINHKMFINCEQQFYYVVAATKKEGTSGLIPVHVYMCMLCMYIMLQVIF